jgi:predicted ATPase
VFDYLTISNFRGLSKVNIQPLSRINLIAGTNDVGKTAVLEAIYLLFSSDKLLQFPTAFRPSVRDQQNNDFWYWLFPERDLQKTAQIEIGKINGQDDLSWDFRTSVRLDSPTRPEDFRDFVVSYDKAGPNGTVQNLGRWSGRPGASWSGVGNINHPCTIAFSINDLSPENVADAYNEVVKMKEGESKMESRMRHLEVRLNRLRYLKMRTAPEVYADLGFEQLVPVTQFGSAFYRLLTIFSGALAKRAKILLIDEIENSLHYSTFTEIWSEFAKIAQEEEMQIFATTHSEECIRGAHQAMSERSSYELAVHRVQRLKGGITEVVTHNREMLAASFDTGLPVR